MRWRTQDENTHWITIKTNIGPNFQLFQFLNSSLPTKGIFQLHSQNRFGENYSRKEKENPSCRPI